MPDISMCNNEQCPSHVTCYRFMATPHPHRQTWATFELEDSATKCNWYMLDFGVEARQKYQQGRRDL